MLSTKPTAGRDGKVQDAKSVSKDANQSALIPPCGVAKPLTIEPQTGNAALKHFNRPEYADIILDVEGAGVFYAHRCYLERNERFRAYSGKAKFAEGSAAIVKIEAPVPWQFYHVLHHLYTGMLVPDWFGAERLAETLCTADYFMLDEVKKKAIKSFPSYWSVVVSSPLFAPDRIPLDIVSKLIAFDCISVPNKFRVLGAWFKRGEDLSPDGEVFKLVTSAIRANYLKPQTLHHLREELGSEVFNCIVPSSFMDDVFSKWSSAQNQNNSSEWVTYEETPRMAAPAASDRVRIPLCPRYGMASSSEVSEVSAFIDL
ncbi:hypothetical protein HK102_007189 [Quaeritorhiza haematococci]|nr:hypothetical protein HK102_007189 [Quaeritorhiza haematococci]